MQSLAIASTPQEPARPPPSELTTALFKHCMDFTLSSTVFIGKTEDLRRVGINAQVLAAHSGEGGRVLGTLVSEIGSLTHQIAPILEALSQSGALLARNAVATATYNQLLVQYRAAWDRGLDDSTGDTLLRVYREYYAAMNADFLEIQQRLHEHTGTLADLRRTTVFIPALISLLKITVAEFDQAAQQFDVTAQELDEFRCFILDATTSMNASVVDALELIDRILAEEQKP